MEWLSWINSPDAWMALLTLTVLEIVLGIDNIIFISILVGRLPREQQEKARRLGLFLAMFMRVGLLLSLSAIMRLTDPLFTMPLMNAPISARDLILLTGGLFLLWKSTREIHHNLEGHQDGPTKEGRPTVSFASVIGQIALLDIIFSLDSVITAVGMADDIPVMIIAVVVAVGVMLFTAKSIGDYVEAHPTLKMLALSFLILVGMSLIAEGFHHHVPKGYVYFAMGFSVFVEMLNLRLRKHVDDDVEPVQLRGSYMHPDAGDDDGPPKA